MRDLYIRSYLPRHSHCHTLTPTCVRVENKIKGKELLAEEVNNPIFTLIDYHLSHVGFGSYVHAGLLPS